MKIISIPIEVICGYKESGEPTPYRFRVKYNDEEVKVYDIKVITKEKTKDQGEYIWKFDCKIIDEGIEKRCEIRNNLNSCKWILYRI